MVLLIDREGLVLEAITAAIARSQIVVREPARPASRFPVGFEDVDVAVLEWIAAEGRRLGRSFVQM